MNIGELLGKFREFRAEISPATKELKFSLKRMARNPLSVFGIAIIGFFALIAIFADFIAPPVKTLSSDSMMIWHDGHSIIPLPPGSPVLDPFARKAGWTTHYLGVGEGGYDIFYGIIWGTRTAFRIGISVQLISVVLGVAIGSIAGYHGGIIDELMMRFTELVLAFPDMILAMVLVIALPRVWPIDVGFILVLIAVLLAPGVIGRILKISRSWVLLATLAGFIAFIVLDVYVFAAPVWTLSLEIGQLDKVLIAFAIFGWPGYCRVIRGETLRVKQEAYVEAARAVGCSDLRIIARHILPNSIYPVIVMASLGIGGTVLTTAALSFLGIGAPYGYADWGQMVRVGENWMMANVWKYWYVFTFPGIAIFLFVLGWTLLGDALRDVMDPTLRRR